MSFDCVWQESPDVGVPLHIEIVEVVGVLRLAEVGTFQPLDDLCFHHSGNVGREQGQQQALLLDKTKHKTFKTIFQVIH